MSWLFASLHMLVVLWMMYSVREVVGVAVVDMCVARHDCALMVVLLLWLLWLWEKGSAGCRGTAGGSGVGVGGWCRWLV